MTEQKIGVYKKIMGSLCHHCPLCKYGRRNPRSVVGKILHHPLHADNCPMWKAEKMLYPDKVENFNQNRD
jgi:hypothetical protein